MPINIDDLDQWLATDNHVRTAAQKYGVDPRLVHSMIRQESAGNPMARSPKGAQGLMQLMPATAAELGVKDPFDPAQNIDGGTRYMSQLLKRYGGDTNKALMAYNAGMGNVDSGKAASFPETQDYVKRITGRLNAGAPQQAQTPPAAPKASAIDLSDLDAFLAGGNPPAAKPAAKPAVPARTWGDTFTDVGIGALKGAGSTAVNLGRLVHRIPGVSSAVDALYGAAGVNVDSAADFGLKPQNNLSNLIAPQEQASAESRLGLNPTNTAQKVGFVGEQIGEAFIPGTMASKAMKGMGLGTRMLGEAAVNAGTATAQNGDPVTAAVLGAGVTGLGGVAKGAARWTTKKVFKPSDKILTASPTVVDDLLDKGIMPTKQGVSTAKGAMLQARKVADDLVAKKQAEPAHFIPGPQGTFRSNSANLRAEVTDPVFHGRTSLKNPTLPNALGEVEEALEKTPSLRTAARMEANILKDNPAEVSLTRLHQIKRKTGQIGRKVFQGDADDVALRKQLNADLHNSADEALGRRIGPEWSQANANTQRELQVLNAARDALKRNQNAQHMTVGNLSQWAMKHALFGGAGAMAGGVPGAIAADLLGNALFTAPNFQRAARGLNQAAKAAPAVGRTAAALSNSNTRLQKAEVDSLYEKYRTR